MKTRLHTHIERLRLFHGSYSQAARAIGMDVRSFRRGRNCSMSKSAGLHIIAEGKLLALRMVLRTLINDGMVSPLAIRQALRKALGSRSQ